MVFVDEGVEVEAGEEAVYIGLGVPVFVAMTGVSEVAVVAEILKISVFVNEEEGFEEGNITFSASI